MRTGRFPCKLPSATVSPKPGGGDGRVPLGPPPIELTSAVPRPYAAQHRHEDDGSPVQWVGRVAARLGEQNDLGKRGQLGPAAVRLHRGKKFREEVKEFVGP